MSYRVVIRRHDLTDEHVVASAVASDRQADRIADGADRNLDHDHWAVFVEEETEEHRP